MRPTGVQGGVRLQEGETGIDASTVGEFGAIQGQFRDSGGVGEGAGSATSKHFRLGGNGIPVYIPYPLKERSVDFRLRIVGGGPVEQPLHTLAARLQLDYRVEFIRPLPRKELGALYQTAEIVCVPSRSDPLPTVVLEAMAAGVPVVGSDTGGIPFMVQDGVTGWVVPCENFVAFANLIGSLHGSRDLLANAGQAAKAAATVRFEWKYLGEVLCTELINTIDKRYEGAAASRN